MKFHSSTPSPKSLSSRRANTWSTSLVRQVLTKKTWTVENSKPVGDPKVEKVDSVNAVIRVGDEDFTGVVKHEVPEEIPFEVKEDPTLPVGKIVVDQQGEKGSKTTRYTQNIKNGEPDGEMKSEEIAKKEPKKHIVRVGKKPATNDLKVNKEVGVDIEYVYDPNMDVTTAKKSLSLIHI